MNLCLDFGGIEVNHGGGKKPIENSGSDVIGIPHNLYYNGDIIRFTATSFNIVSFMILLFM